MAELIGGTVAGWKVGATVRAVQVFEGHDGPLPGRIFADRLFDSPAKIPASLFKGVKVECEFAFRLTRDLPAGNGPVTRDQIAGSLTFHPAFELAGSRFAPGTGNRAATTFDGVADNGSGGAAVLGAAVDRLAEAAVRDHGDRCAHRRQPADPDLHRRLSARSGGDHRRDLLGPARARRAAAGRHLSCSPARSRCRRRCARARP